MTKNRDATARASSAAVRWICYCLALTMLGVFPAILGLLFTPMRYRRVLRLATAHDAPMFYLVAEGAAQMGRGGL